MSVSTLCLGTMTFGEADESSFMHKVGCDEPTSHAILDVARGAGLNFIDTADVYGQGGPSERVVGSWFHQGGGRRESTVLAPKFRFSMGDGSNKSGAARYRIVRCVEESLRRLHTDHIDLYQVHMQDLDTPEDELLRALDDLVTIAREFGVGILPWSPLAGGFLTGKYRQNAAPPSGTWLDKWTSRYEGFDTPRNWRTLHAVREVAEETGATPGQVSLAWLIQKPGVSSVIFGARSLLQLQGNLPAGDLALSDAQMTRLDEASKPDPAYPYSMLERVQGRW